MYKKFAFLIVALTFLMFSQLNLEQTVYGKAIEDPCTAGVGELTNPRLTITVIMTKICDDQENVNATWEGRCKNNFFESDGPAPFQRPVYPDDHDMAGLPKVFGDIDASDLEGANISFNPGEGEGTIFPDGCAPEGSNEIGITEVNVFHNTGVSIYAEVIAKFWVCE